MTTRVYVAGPMTGLPEYNLPAIEVNVAKALDIEVRPLARWLCRTVEAAP